MTPVRRPRVWQWLVPCLGLAVAVNLLTGASRLSLAEVYYSLLAGFGVDVAEVLPASKAVIFWHIRVPRILLAGAVGASLGMAGAALQSLLRNPLAEPGLIGVSSGAALFTVVVLVFGVGVGTTLGAFLLPLAAFVGSLIFTLIVFSLARWLGQSSGVFLILAGIGITALAEALIGVAIFFSDDASLRSFTFWRMGGLAGATWLNLAVAVPLMVLPSLGLVRLAPKLDALALGEHEAHLLGLNVGRAKSAVILCTALAVGAAVSVSGLIVFVGLAVPHIVRLLVGAGQRRVLPVAAGVGAVLLLVADAFARTLVAPAELPVGMLTALLGAPMLLWILTHDFRRTRHA
ncbi:MAG: iron ABC transporter permease [Bacteroidia bacterium]|nr:iron ABC transporter permease [Bacteroidia bacterium]